VLNLFFGNVAIANSNITCCTVKKRFVITTYFLCQINVIIIYLVEITYYFEFLMVKLIYFIILTHFFQFNQLKILRQPGYLLLS